MIELSTIDNDLVIKSKFLTGKTNYKFALGALYPLINRLDIQRSLQNPSFYKRLRQDLIVGCITPPITLALINEEDDLPNNIDEANIYINSHIQDMFILDGIQRLNTLHTAYSNPELEKSLDLSRPLFLNILICKSMDNLLYRMITLNNGQKPMSADHQIEILLGNIYNFNELKIDLITNKEKGENGNRSNLFDKSSIIKGYLGFITNSISIDNKKIINEKMDNLIAKKIIDSKITEDNLEFSNIIDIINELSTNLTVKKWFDNVNNLIGFCVGIKKSYNYIKDILPDNFESSLSIFEETFKSLNLSSIKLGKERRNLSRFFIEEYERLHNLDTIELLDTLNENVL